MPHHSQEAQEDNLSVLGVDGGALLSFLQKMAKGGMTKRSRDAVLRMNPSAWKRIAGAFEQAVADEHRAIPLFPMLQRERGWKAQESWAPKRELLWDPKHARLVRYEKRLFDEGNFTFGAVAETGQLNLGYIACANVLHYLISRSSTDVPREWMDGRPVLFAGTRFEKCNTPSGPSYYPYVNFHGDGSVEHAYVAETDVIDGDGINVAWISRDAVYRDL